MTLTVEQIAIALEKKAGNITHAAKVLKVTRWALYKRINGEETLQQIVTDAREALVDIAESKLLQQVKQGNIAAIIFTLKTQGKARGYVERTEISGANGGNIKVENVSQLSDDERLARLVAMVDTARERGIRPTPSE